MLGSSAGLRLRGRFCEFEGMMKSDTKLTPPPSGDDGTTGLPGGMRVRKSDTIIRAGGSLDELSAALGLVRVVLTDAETAHLLESIQRDLLRIGAELATGKPQQNAPEAIGLDREIQHLNAELPPLNEFILPGKNESSARAHWARTVCRRAECDLVAVQDQDPKRISADMLTTLNRLSSWLFALARSLEL